MRVIKNINNNVSLCLDDNGHELIAFGKGIGFTTPPYDIEDLSMINRTFYDIETRYYDLLNHVDERSFEASIKIVDFAKERLDTKLNPNIVFTLADHIDFVIKRFREDMDMRFTQFYDLIHFYKVESTIGTYGVNLINQIYEIDLPRDEANSIALHFINASSVIKSNLNRNDNNKIIQDVIEIIEKHFSLEIDINSFNYSRFASHIEYLLIRTHDLHEISSTNIDLHKTILHEYPQTYECAVKVRRYINETCDTSLNEEEELYLIMHINRLCARADCYQ